jgi:hypothetical protein
MLGNNLIQIPMENISVAEPEPHHFGGAAAM